MGLSAYAQIEPGPQKRVDHFTPAPGWRLIQSLNLVRDMLNDPEQWLAFRVSAATPFEIPQSLSPSAALDGWRQIGVPIVNVSSTPQGSALKLLSTPRPSDTATRFRLR